jgi:DNA-binding response OmpR family regulator
MAFTVQGANRRTIMLVDPDPHVRAGLRVALEAAGFTVGEAANAREGARTALRIRPDAIMLELMLETIDAGSLMAQRLREMGEKFPIFVVSQAARALHGNVDVDELGIAGVFAKPLNLPEVIETLRRRLHAGE